MNDRDLQQQLEEAKKTIGELQAELDKTSEGLIAVHIELDQRIEAERREKEHLAEQLERELGIIDDLSNATHTQVSAKMLGIELLYESQPDIFRDLSVKDRSM